MRPFLSPNAHLHSLVFIHSCGTAVALLFEHDAHESRPRRNGDRRRRNAMFTYGTVAILTYLTGMVLISWAWWKD